MVINTLRLEKPFYGLFPIDKEIVSSIAKDISKNGYDLSHPVVIWKDKEIVIDGNTRVEAAKQAGLEFITVDEKEFEDQEHAIEYAIKNQRNRRNLTDADLLRCIEAIDKKRPKGGDRKSDMAKSKGANEPIDSSAKVTAKMVGTSETKVKKARSIIDHADQATRAAVESGNKTIHRAYQETQKKRTPGRAAAARDIHAKNNKKKIKHTETHEVSDAMFFAELAITQLNSIRDEDPEREKAFDSIEQWIVDHGIHRELLGRSGIRAIIWCLDNLLSLIVPYGRDVDSDDLKYGVYFREIHEGLSRLLDIINSRREIYRHLPKYEDLPKWIQRRIIERMSGPISGPLPKI